jgi:hypothetical protein
MAFVQNRVDRSSVTERLARELAEAAESARRGGQLELARNCDDRAEVMRLASALRTEATAG